MGVVQLAILASRLILQCLKAFTGSANVPRNALVRENFLSEKKMDHEMAVSSIMPQREYK
ncbi:uncharacterized protein PHALS_10385 [Plasmopara halstedii]|uniref:RxLR-like protein n=1 Tax=Plasmopara halstedii TaxID=4781 RepID=A0A0P1AGC1_PLAHL|nr:uncharacterized protein PHALS_10385 [Plasmopara halstedii]CEG40173.1 hypothetical protein PHALS_10385 [Plasmopara halstedii]|eukprot:XP_024576542.1 hypothetical protein PHALS_10385 [Plasmopara halstedii]